jgi:hypothetical protein
MNPRQIAFNRVHDFKGGLREIRDIGLEPLQSFNKKGESQFLS